MLKRAAVGFAAFFLLTSVGLGQDNRYDVAVGAAGVLSKQSSGNGTTLTPTQGWGVVATGRIRFTHSSSVELNFSRAKNSQIYAASPFNYRIQDTITEFTGAYVFSFHQSEKLEPFVFVGGGLLVFNPNSTSVNNSAATVNASRQYPLALLYGGGADYRFLSRLPKLALRLQYRGLVYSAPDFKVPNLFTASKGHMAEPSVGLVVKF